MKTDIGLPDTLKTRDDAYGSTDVKIVGHRWTVAALTEEHDGLHARHTTPQSTTTEDQVIG
jgi:hypothetical protein